MSASIQDHFHLMTTMPEAGESTGEWEASADGFKPSLVPEEMIFAQPQYSITGKLFTHVLTTGGDPVQKQNWTFNVSLSLTAYADMLTWLSYDGKDMYFVPNYHDQADHQTYAKYVFVQQMMKPDVMGVQYDHIEIPTRLLETA